MTPIERLHSSHISAYKHWYDQYFLQDTVIIYYICYKIPHSRATRSMICVLQSMNGVMTLLYTRSMQGMFGASVSELYLLIKSLINTERTVDLCVITKIHMYTGTV